MVNFTLVLDKEELFYLIDGVSNYRTYCVDTLNDHPLNCVHAQKLLRLERKLFQLSSAEKRNYSPGIPDPCQVGGI